jgi:5-formyltetrahydrofolate cyclo-ligase
MESSAASQKAIKRRIVRERRRNLSADAQAVARLALIEIIKKNINLGDYRTIAGYLAQDGEIDPSAALTLFREAGAQILLPRTGPDRSLVFAPEGRLEPTGPAGIEEPTGAAVQLADVKTPAILLVPSVALSPTGGRLGRGGGFYDRALPALYAAGWQICGLCHDEDFRDDLRLESHDQPVNWCLTEKRLVKTGRLA